MEGYVILQGWLEATNSFFLVRNVGGLLPAAGGDLNAAVTGCGLDSGLGVGAVCLSVLLVV